MRIAPISFRSFAAQNLNNQQRSHASNVSFQRAYGYDDDEEDKGYKLYKSSVPLIENGRRIYGKTYVKDDGREVTVKVNANGRDVGEARFGISNGFAAVNNYSSMKKVGTAAYDSLFSYLKKNHPEIKRVRVNCTNDGSYRFHIAYGFTDGYKNDPDGYDCYSMTNYLDYSLR